MHLLEKQIGAKFDVTTVDAEELKKRADRYVSSLSLHLWMVPGHPAMSAM